MQTVSIEHNLSDYELEEALEKSLKAVRKKIQKPVRQQRVPALAASADVSMKRLSGEMEKMIRRVKQVINR